MTAHILLADDERDAELLFRQQFRRELRRRRFTFDFSLSGEAALAFLESRNRPDAMLILSDINMPGMSGLDLLGRVKARWPDLVVFMITAYGDAETEARARAAGAQEFIHKPVDFAALKDRLRRFNRGGDEA